MYIIPILPIHITPGLWWPFSKMAAISETKRQRAFNFDSIIGFVGRRQISQNGRERDTKTSRDWFKIGSNGESLQPIIFRKTTHDDDDYHWWFDWLAPAMPSLVCFYTRMLRKCTFCWWNVVHISAFPCKYVKSDHIYITSGAGFVIKENNKSL